MTSGKQWAARETLHEDEDDWLNGYLAATPYASDAKLTSNPIAPRPPKKEEKVKQVYSLYAKGQKNSRRASWSSSPRDSTQGKSWKQSLKDVTSSITTSTSQPHVSVLPDRVNAIRPVDSGPSGHFVREHRNSNEKRPSSEMTESELEGALKAAKKLATTRERRRTVNYDELDAVKTRVMQAASMWDEGDEDDDDSDDVDMEHTTANVPHVIANEGAKAEEEKEKEKEKGRQKERERVKDKEKAKEKMRVEKEKEGEKKAERGNWLTRRWKQKGFFPTGKLMNQT
eukprot:TRINITY_DN1563_c1_g2_i1.p1 TRINITY_DN1563_c1_g2~~TRINITY_DN1563_c1_g2_i1.p1  ORF type:complete len:285 (+),score=70.55 TRINITY_DN1563_c1_g2_i1:204-1058(+)